MLKTFLKPGWVLSLIFIVAFSYLSFTVLAPWQLNKDAQIVERNHLIEEAYDADPQPVTEVFSADGSLHKEWERVELTGHYLSEDEVLLRLRPVESAPGFQSLVPFETESGETFLVNRGWMPTDEGNSVPHIAPAPQGKVTIVAMARYDERKHTSAPIEEQGYTQVYSINTEQIAELVDVPLAHDYLQLSPEQPGELHALPVPKLDRGNHLSYGYQWIAFGVMAPLGFAYFVWSEIRERRRARDEDALIAEATAAATGAGTGSPDAAADVDSSEHKEPSGEHSDATTPAAPPSTPAAATQPSRRSRSRYGSAKPDFYEKIRERGQERY
ncbi:SURF1 family protein [Corynebacterium aurimucosum]|uniref:SURF1 family cytochrome oxidase biogenesis protein n=1 Tax=Corynebacterium aurimucosum TaxID=169292 RepID=UPI00187AB636|nr:SURF1 family protein [Corynebacterium aurimucosum]MBE7364172.1 SURF1 family protein [Corynebacterium aurimucosum]